MKRLLLLLLATALGLTWWALAPSGEHSEARRFASQDPQGPTSGGAAGHPAPGSAADAGTTPADGGPYWAEAEAALAAGDVDRAEELLDVYLATEAPSAAVLEMLSTLARRDGDAATAIDYAESAVALQPERSMAHVALTRALRTELAGMNPLKAMLGLGRLKETMERALQLDPDNADALVDQAFFSLYAPSIAGGDLDRVREIIARLDDLDPEEARRLEVLLLQKEEKPEQAIALCRESLETSPDSQALHMTLGMLLFQAEDIAAAEAAFRAAHEGPDLASRYSAGYQLAMLLIEDGRGHVEALALLTDYMHGLRCADLMIPASAAHWRIGMAHEGLGDLAAAQASYEESLRLDEDFDRARESLAALREKR